MKIIAVIPTYNEAGNIEHLIDKLLALPLDVGVLVVDDFSPDGTHLIVEKITKKNKNVSLLNRKENRGRGWAGIDGFKLALELGADLIVEMDGDMSHPPKFIPEFVKQIGDADMVIGSRYIEGGKDEQRTFVRSVISGFARGYLSLALGLRVSDPTSGYRMFKRGALEKIVPHLKARDPFIVAEVLHYAKKFKLKIKEVPIEFMARGAGTSKLKPTTLLKYLFRVWGLKVRP